MEVSSGYGRMRNLVRTVCVIALVYVVSTASVTNDRHSPKKVPSKENPTGEDIILNFNAPFMVKFCMRCQQIFRNPTNPGWSNGNTESKFLRWN